ncbi:DUF4199 domain-containing protein [Mucilaginibacter sp.]
MSLKPDENGAGEKTNIDRKLRINAIIKGVMLGIIVLTLSIISYYFITTSQVPGLIIAGPYFFAIIIPLAVTILFILNMRKKLGGFWSFKQSVAAVFIMFLISFLILTIGRDFIFAKLIEHDMVTKTEQVMVNLRIKGMKTGGANQKQIDAEIADMKKTFAADNGVGLFSLVQNYIIGVIMLFVLSLVFASIFKKEPV